MWFRSMVGTFESSAARTPSRPKRRRQRRRRPAERLRLESLEGRCLLSFMAPVEIGAETDRVAVGDFANNGIQDIAAIGNGGFAFSDEVSVLMGKGDGAFQAAQVYSVPGDTASDSIAVGDVTGDGKLDIVTTGYYYGAYGPGPGSVSVLVGNGDGAFQSPITFRLPYGSYSETQEPLSVALGDMNHDGRFDAIVTTKSYSGSGFDVDVLLGNGDGSLSLVSSTPVGESLGGPVSLADFNGDGNLDVAASTSSGLAVLLGNGDGTLAPPMDLTAGAYPGVATGDVNGDGKSDLVTASAADTSVSVLLGNGDGSFQAPQNIALPSWYPPGYSGADALAQRPRAVVVGDLNGDGKMDLAVTARSSLNLSTAYVLYTDVNILLGNGDGSFTDAQIIPLEDDSSITAADFNRDGYLDLAVPEVDAVGVLLNGADWSTVAQPSSLSVSGFPSSAVAGASGTFTVTAWNGDGTVDTGYTGTVSFSSSDGQAALPSAYTFTAADAGVHAFCATLKTAGTQSITVVDAHAPDVMGSETGIAVTPAAASRFIVSAPASVTAGVSFSVTVTVEDAYGNTVTGYLGTIDFSSSDRHANLPANYTFTASDRGVHAFTGLVLNTTGYQAITVTDTQTSGLIGTTDIDVLAAKKGHGHSPSKLLARG